MTTDRTNRAPEIRDDLTHRLLYATDASIYEEIPTAVAFPRDAAEVASLIRTSAELGLSLIPRAAGTSLAGQCVGSGVVLDLGRYMNRILSIDAARRIARVEPGVILDDLNRALKPHGLFFAPDTSTANRCMIGGMIGNNSCGTHSILYGTTRDHVASIRAAFSDGALYEIEPWSKDEWRARIDADDALGRGLRALDAIVGELGDEIRARYPKERVVRRNTGYALDEIARRAPYGLGGDFDLIRLLCGSEGTLAVTCAATLKLEPLPGARTLVVAHFRTLESSLGATEIAVSCGPAAVELIDRRILGLARQNLEQARHAWFVEGEPEALLVVEFFGADQVEVAAAASALVAKLKAASLGYAYPVIDPPRDHSVWELRKAGLGILMGMPGDTKPVTVVEDTAVAVEDLRDYIRDFSALMARHKTQCVYYAHASVGELHLRPELNLKDPKDVQKFKAIATEVTELVRHYGGSISGEHGDGRLRAPMLEQFYGAPIAEAHRRVKRAFDPRGVLNPGKIVDARPIDDDWRFEPGESDHRAETSFRWGGSGGLLRALEKCNGAGVCRKRAEAGGTMCPSYMVTLEERDSTRGRANVFRHLLRSNEDPRRAMASEELSEVMDLCISCKGCKSECPANVDMSRMKAEFLQGYWDAHGAPLSAKLFARYPELSKLGARLPGLANFGARSALGKAALRRILKVDPRRTMPPYAQRAARELWSSWIDAGEGEVLPGAPVVGLYIDPFTNFTEPRLALSALRVLSAGGYRVELTSIEDDGRTYLSKGFVREARGVLDRAVDAAQTFIEEHPGAAIVGLEPSSLLTFRDEAADLVSPERVEGCAAIAERALLLDEFVAREGRAGRWAGSWSPERDVHDLVLHGHCHQKALCGISDTIWALEFAGYRVRALPTGCCGMAGSFGYEAKHYDISMKIGELVLFPSLRETSAEIGVVAPGTSCRHQIKDGVGRDAEHPAVWFERALARSSTADPLAPDAVLGQRGERAL